jgi:hypothetical protein
MTPDQFIEKWSRADRTERQAAQEHFIDLCRVLGDASRTVKVVTSSVLLVTRANPSGAGSGGTEAAEQVETKGEDRL